MSMEDILLRVISQTYKDKYCMIWLYELKKKSKYNKKHIAGYLPETEHEEKGEIF